MSDKPDSERLLKLEYQVTTLIKQLDILEKSMVFKTSFIPVQWLVFGFTGSVLVAFVGVLLVRVGWS